MARMITFMTKIYQAGVCVCVVCRVFFGAPLMPETCLTVQPPDPFPMPKPRLAEQFSLAVPALHQLLQRT